MFQSYGTTYPFEKGLDAFAFRVSGLMTSASRRQRAAILSADVVGYVSLMEAAEEATHARLMELQLAIIDPTVIGHHGRIVKNTGDGFLAAFDEVMDAVDCALYIQEKLARLARSTPPILLRMGINVADVIVEPHDIFGEGVNLAARLQASAEAGGIVISAEAADGLRARPEMKVTDLGVLTLKHIRRPVRAFSLTTSVNPFPATSYPTLPPDERPSIAVLPLQQETGDVEAGRFASGIIEGVIHTLSGIENLFVIARGTTRVFAGQEIDPRAVGRELGVRYVLSGNVRRAGNQLRIITELAETSNGRVIRSDRRDCQISDLFDMQDQIAGEVVASIAPKVREQELLRAMRKHPDSKTGYDLAIEAVDLLFRLEPDTFNQARGLLQQAMAHGPGYGPAYSYAATWHMFRIGQGWTPDPAADGAEAARCAVAALERDGNDAVALAIHGHMLAFTRHDYDAAIHFLDRAVGAGPGCHMAWTLSSATRGWTSDGIKAIDHAKRALLVSPLDPFTFFTEHMLSQGYYVTGDYPSAVAWGQCAAMRNGMLTSNLRTLAASLVAVGNIEAAREIAKRILSIEPEFRLGNFVKRTPFQPEILKYHIVRLRTAGLPD